MTETGAPLGGAEARAGDLPVQEAIGLTDDAVAVFDAEDALVAANPAFRRIYGALAPFSGPEASLAILLLEAERRHLLPQEVCQRIGAVETELIGRSTSAPIAVRLPDGQSTEIRLTRLSNAGLAWVQREAVDQERVEQDRHEAEQLMAKVLEACPASLTMARIGDGQILYRSPAATELLGNVRTSNEHFVDRIERADFVTALLSGARVDDLRIRGRRHDGAEFPASISARLIDYRDEEVVVASIVDLTADLAMQDELTRQKELNFQSEKMSALGELLAGVAHELNNPLSIVVGNAAILREELERSPLETRVEKLSNAAERCVRIVRTFLAMVREQPLELKPTPVIQLASAARDAYLASVPVGSLDVDLEVPQTLPQVMADEVQIVQVLVNLLTNAHHAIADTGRPGRVELAAHALRDGSVTITVADDGPGIPREIRSRIFDPLFTTKETGKGTGMGLSLCQRIVVSHGGAIRLVDLAGAGATFEIRLRAEPPSEA